ncbi:MAG: cytochrome c oxidase subunit II [Anaerolineales bacterium]|nr:cytochrome c oxidase subunit II [Anaerolineales bacterium]
MRHFVIVAILVLVMAVLTYIGLDASGLMPVEASAQAASIDWLWNLEVITISFLFALIIVPMFYSLVVFRRRKGETGDGEHIEGNTPLEITWTVIPLFIVLGFAYLGAYSLGETRRVDPQAMEINVTAQQFAFSFEYPDYGIVSNELYLPVNKQAILKMTSRDVIHSFWVPEFRIKQDIVPGRVTEYRITPTLLTGDQPFKVRCAELCGASHAYMLSDVQVVTQDDFDAWVAGLQVQAAAAAQTPAGRGETLALQNGCQGCHTIDGSPGTGPTWLGLYGKEEEMADGSVIIADNAYLRESILDPQAKIVAGFEGVLMPAYEFSDDQIADIIAYLETLK